MSIGHVKGSADPSSASSIEMSGSSLLLFVSCLPSWDGKLKAEILPPGDGELPLSSLSKPLNSVTLGDTLSRVNE